MVWVRSYGKVYGVEIFDSSVKCGGKWMLYAVIETETFNTSSFLDFMFESDGCAFFRL